MQYAVFLIPILKENVFLTSMLSWGEHFSSLSVHFLSRAPTDAPGGHSPLSALRRRSARRAPSPLSSGAPPPPLGSRARLLSRAPEEARAPASQWRGEAPPSTCPMAGGVAADHVLGLRSCVARPLPRARPLVSPRSAPTWGPGGGRGSARCSVLAAAAAGQGVETPPLWLARVDSSVFAVGCFFCLLRCFSSCRTPFRINFWESHLGRFLYFSCV